MALLLSINMYTKYFKLMKYRGYNILAKCHYLIPYKFHIFITNATERISCCGFNSNCNIRCLT